jgi:predicted dehydrogenase
MQEHERFTDVAAWDPSETARATTATECPGLTSAENADRIFSDPSINTIYIASPPQTGHGI